MDFLNGSPQTINYFSDELYKKIYDLRGDAFKHRVALEQAAAEANAHGFKTFKGMYRAYEQGKKGLAQYLSAATHQSLRGSRWSWKRVNGGQTMPL